MIQHYLHAVACACGKVHQAARPAGAGAPGTVTYGPNLQAWRVFLIVAQAIPVHRCAELIETGPHIRGPRTRQRRRGRAVLSAIPDAQRIPVP